jgi:hypothetical protein
VRLLGQPNSFFDPALRHRAALLRRGRRRLHGGLRKRLHERAGAGAPDIYPALDRLAPTLWGWPVSGRADIGISCDFMTCMAFSDWTRFRGSSS